MLLLLGKTASGKDTIRKVLLNRGMKPLISYTTRPPRDDEKNGVDYFFVDDNTFDALSSMFLCITEKENNDKTYRYGMPVPNDSDNTVAIVSPEELRYIKMLGRTDITSVYLLCDEGTIWNRLRLRGDDSVEARKRLNDDDERFRDLIEQVDYGIRNQRKVENVADMIYRIYYFLEGKMYV